MKIKLVILDMSFILLIKHNQDASPAPGTNVHLDLWTFGHTDLHCICTHGETVYWILRGKQYNIQRNNIFI